MSLTQLILVITGTLTGLLTGAFYIFTVAIIPALRSLNAKEHITTMQAINVKIVNPAFMLSFFGPTLLLPIAAFLYRGAEQFPLLVVVSVLHIVGVNGITIVGNVPLNNGLAKVNVDKLSETEAEQIRGTYHGQGSSWMRLHNLRTLVAVVATATIFIVCLSNQMRD